MNPKHSNVLATEKKLNLLHLKSGHTTLKKPFLLSSCKTVLILYCGKHLEICLPKYDLFHDVLSDLCLLSSSTCYKTCQLWNYTFFVMWVIALEDFQVENTTCSWRHNSDFLQMYKSTDVAVRCTLFWLSHHSIFKCQTCHVSWLKHSWCKIPDFFSVVQSRQGHASEYTAFKNII